MKLHRRFTTAAAAVLVGVFAMGASAASARTRPPSGPPAAPTNLKVTATTFDSVSLSWNASASAGVTYTLVITNPAIDSETTGKIPGIATTSYTWSNALVQPGQTYSFAVFAVNSRGQDSADSNTVTTTTPAAPLPPAPQVSVTGTTGWSITLTISDSQPDTFYRILVNGTTPSDVGGSLYPDQTGTVTIINLSPGTTYSIAVTAVNQYDQAGGTTTISGTTMTSTDTTAPSAPTNFSVSDYEQALGYGCTQQTLTWDPSSDPNFAQADLYYEVLVNGVDQGGDNILGDQISGGVLSETVFLPAGTDTIDVVAINPDGLVSAPSNSFTGNFTEDEC
jgi:hypothetical protein